MKFGLKCSSLHVKKHKTMKFQSTWNWLETSLESLQRIHDLVRLLKNIQVLHRGNILHTLHIVFIIKMITLLLVIFRWKGMLLSFLKKLSFGNTILKKNNCTERLRNWRFAMRFELFIDAIVCQNRCSNCFETFIKNFCRALHWAMNLSWIFELKPLKY